MRGPPWPSCPSIKQFKYLLSFNGKRAKDLGRPRLNNFCFYFRHWKAPEGPLRLSPLQALPPPGPPPSRPSLSRPSLFRPSQLLCPPFIGRMAKEFGGPGGGGPGRASNHKCLFMWLILFLIKNVQGVGCLEFLMINGDPIITESKIVHFFTKCLSTFTNVPNFMFDDCVIHFLRIEYSIQKWYAHKKWSKKKTFKNKRRKNCSYILKSSKNKMLDEVTNTSAISTTGEGDRSKSLQSICKFWNGFCKFG